MSDIIYLSDVRLSFPNLIEPQKTVQDDGKERISYNADFIMAPEHPGFQAFMQRYGTLAQAEWKEHAGSVMQMIQSDRKSRCYGQGSERINKKTFQPYDGYVNMVYISAGSKNPPQMIQGDGKPIDPMNTMAYQAMARKLYGGCRVNAAVKPWLQQNKHGRGVRCDLIAVQFLRDDTAFGAGNADVSGMFGAVAQTPVVGAPVAMPASPFPQAQAGATSFVSPTPPATGAPSMPPFMMGK